MHKRCPRRAVISGLVIPTLIVVTPLARAAGIGPGRFAPGATVQRFDGRSGPLPAPLVQDGATYTTSSGELYFGFSLTDPTPPDDAVDQFNLFETASDGWIDVVFDQPAARAGGWVLGSSGRVEFYDASDALLGAVDAPVPPGDDWYLASFAGWEADALPIRRVRFNDIGNIAWSIGIDSMTWEPIPEPATALVFTAALLGRRRRRAPA
jgi:hypothetical protein